MEETRHTTTTNLLKYEPSESGDFLTTNKEYNAYSVANKFMNTSASKERLTPENIRKVVYFGGALMGLGALLMGGALLLIFSPQAAQFVNTSIQKVGAQPVDYNNLVIEISGLGVSTATIGLTIAGSICFASGLVYGKNKSYRSNEGLKAQIEGELSKIDSKSLGDTEKQIFTELKNSWQELDLHRIENTQMYLKHIRDGLKKINNPNIGTYP